MTPEPARARAGPGWRAGWLAALVALLTTAVAGLSWWQADRTQALLREQTLLRAEQRSLQLADAMSAQVLTLLGGIDVALQQLRREWHGDTAQFDPLARALVAALPPGAVSHVTVVGADGRTLYNSLDPREQVFVGDRAHFRVHLDGVDRLHVGKPVFSRLSDRWTVIVNRPLLRDGVFAGTMNMSVSTAFIAERLAAVALSEQDVVALVAGDGSFVARSRDLERSMGQQLPADRPFLADPAAKQGIFRVPGQLDGVARIYGWHRVPGHDLVTTVGLAEDAALAPLAAGLERERWTVRALTAAAALSGLVVAVLLWQAGRRQRALAHSERRYRTLLDSAPDAIYVTQGGRFAYLNPAALRLFGAQQASQLLGQPVMDRIHPDSRAAVQARIRTLVQERRPVPALAERYLRLDGSAVDVEVTAAPYAGGPDAGRQVIVRDITERRRAEMALQRLNDELEQRVAERTAGMAAARDEAERANRAKSEFLSRMSHELRTPLNAILGFGQLLALEAGDATQAARVREIIGAGRHLLSLINDVLDLARIEAGELSISAELVALQPLIGECLALLQPQAAARRIRLQGPPEGLAAQVLADRTRLKQVLLNLLSTAVKYNREAGTASVACVDEGAAWQLRVTDTGPGLDAAQQARLFVPFERLDAERTAVEGTGIGLALTRRLVELMGGCTGVDSTPGEGSSFWVRLPKASAPQAAVRPPQAAVDPAAAGMATDVAGAAPDATGTVDVLCIEDNPVNMLLVEGIVALRPRLRLLRAATPGRGLALARTQRPRLILLDIHLPEMDGFEVMRRLREDAATRDIPVVAVSASAMPADIARGRAAGVDDYLTKPLEVERLLQLLAERCA